MAIWNPSPPSGSSGTFSVVVPTGAVDGMNTVFTFSSAPSVIILDNGNAMNKVSSDGRVNWTGTTTVTLTQVPTFNIYGLARTGGVFNVMVPTGTVNGINTSFTFSSAPSVIVLDNGNMMNKVSSDSTANWSGTTSIVLLNQSPTFNIYGF